MAKSALLKSSIAKKYWMALTGLFLCLFLVGHLAGNLQLIFGTSKQFNEYALFMTTNPAVKLLSYLTYISILFHAIDGILLTIQNKKARPIGYAKTDGSSSSFASRNMAVLGTIILVFIATHMVNFWAKMHFDQEMPLAKQESMQMPDQFEYIGVPGSRIQNIPIQNNMSLKEMVDNANKQQMAKAPGMGENPDKSNTKKFELVGSNSIKDVKSGEIIFTGYKDLHKLTVDFFKSKKKLFGIIPNEGLLFTIGYVLAMLALSFHLWHGFQSAFQTIGVNSSKLTPVIKFFGKAFAIIVPLLFAIIPLILHFKK
jgi:succinate dehydrogenase / fumarate reductase, cytochrome b subunit